MLALLKRINKPAEHQPTTLADREQYHISQEGIKDA